MTSNRLLSTKLVFPIYYTAKYPNNSPGYSFNPYGYQSNQFASGRLIAFLATQTKASMYYEPYSAGKY